MHKWHLNYLMLTAPLEMNLAVSKQLHVYLIFEPSNSSSRRYPFMLGTEWNHNDVYMPIDSLFICYTM